MCNKRSHVGACDGQVTMHLLAHPKTLIADEWRLDKLMNKFILLRGDYHLEVSDDFVH